jgi:hypothetical protein
MLRIPRRSLPWPLLLLAACSGGDGSSGTGPTPDAVASLRLDTRYATPAGGTALLLHADARTAGGAAASGARVTWRALDAGTTVDSTGRVAALAPGLARVAAASGGAADTAWLAVLAPQSTHSTAFAGGAFEIAARPGDAIAVPVLLDMRTVSPTGDLGSAEVEVGFDPAELEFVGVDAPAGGSADANLIAPGRVRLAYAGAAVRGTASFPLATLRMKVAAGAVGHVAALSLSYPVPPTTTGFAPLAAPVAVGGRVRVSQ